MATRKAITKDGGVLQLPLDLVFELAPLDSNRPEVLGDPLAPGASVSFPKPSAHIEIVDLDGDLKLEDRKLYNLLLAVSWGPLGRGESGPFVAPALQLRRRIGQEKERSNRRIRESLERLLKTVVKFRKRMPDGQIGEAATTLLSYWAIAPRNGLVEWEFHPSLLPYLERPSRWARLNLDTCARFHSKYSMVLYEHLSLRKEMDFPIWNASIEELRTFFCVPAERYSYFSQFRQSVLDPALAEVNAHARFHAEMEVIDDVVSQKPARVRFTVLPERKAIA